MIPRYKSPVSDSIFENARSLPYLKTNQKSQKGLKMIIRSPSSTVKRKGLIRDMTLACKMRTEPTPKNREDGLNFLESMKELGSVMTEIKENNTEMGKDAKMRSILESPRRYLSTKKMKKVKHETTLNNKLNLMKSQLSVAETLADKMKNSEFYLAKAIYENQRENAKDVEMDNTELDNYVKDLIYGNQKANNRFNRKQTIHSPKKTRFAKLDTGIFRQKTSFSRMNSEAKTPKTPRNKKTKNFLKNNYAIPALEMRLKNNAKRKATMKTRIPMNIRKINKAKFLPRMIRKRGNLMDERRSSVGLDQKTLNEDQEQVNKDLEDFKEYFLIFMRRKGVTLKKKEKEFQVAVNNNPCFQIVKKFFKCPELITHLKYGSFEDSYDLRISLPFMLKEFKNYMLRKKDDVLNKGNVKFFDKVFKIEEKKQMVAEADFKNNYGVFLKKITEETEEQKKNLERLTTLKSMRSFSSISSKPNKSARSQPLNPKKYKLEQKSNFGILNTIKTRVSTIEAESGGKLSGINNYWLDRNNLIHKKYSQIDKFLKSKKDVDKRGLLDIVRDSRDRMRIMLPRCYNEEDFNKK